MNAQDIKRLAYQFGADICGIASMDRFEGAPKQMDPRYIMPEAKSMIVDDSFTLYENGLDKAGEVVTIAKN